MRHEAYNLKNQSRVKKLSIPVIVFVIIGILGAICYSLLTKTVESSEQRISIIEKIFASASTMSETEGNIQSSYDWISDTSASIGTIAFSSDGNDVLMTGNTNSAGKNAMYTIPTTRQKADISFDYDIDFGDSFNSAGVLVGLTKEGNNLKGYMVSFNNARWASECESKNAGIWEITYSLGSNNSNVESKTLRKAFDINSSGTLTINATSEEITVSGGGLTDPVSYEIGNYYGSGVGFVSDHYDHGCDNSGSFNLTDISMQTTDENTGTFNLKINVSDDSAGNIDLGNAEFMLIHPKPDTPDERLVIYGTSNEDGVCTIQGQVMGEGTYEYILYQTEAPVGYEAAGLVSLKITFDEHGQITNVTKQYNDKMQLAEFTGDKVVINVLSKIEGTGDTYDLQVQLEDEADPAIRVSSVQYKILVKAESGEMVGITDSTDGNGQINILERLTGDGEVTIQLQQTSSVGYILDDEVKTVKLKRNASTGVIDLIATESSNYINVEIYSDTVRVILRSQKKETQNKVQVKIIDNVDREVVLNGLQIQVKNEDTTQIVTGITSGEGIANIYITGARARTYKYAISVLNMPSSYSALDTIRIQVEFDEAGNIKNVTEITDKALETSYKQEDTIQNVDSTAFVKIGLNRSASFESYRIKIVKTDELDTNKKLSEVEYEIISKNGGVERKTNKTTNAWGEVSVEIPMESSLEIKITEVKAKKGYILDNTTKTIRIGRDDKDIPEIRNQSEGIDVTLDNSNKMINVIDTNLRKIDSEDAKANITFYLTKKDDEGNLLPDVTLVVKELVTSRQYTLSTNDLGKAELKDFEVPDVGTYTFEIIEQETVPGYLLPEEKIVIEITYEIVNDEMRAKTFVVMKGDKYVLEKNSEQYESDTAYQLDVFLTILNLPDGGFGEFINIDLRNIDAITGDIEDPRKDINAGSYDVTITYDDTARTRIVRTDVAQTADQEIKNIRATGTVTIEILEHTTPLGYDADANVKKLDIQVDEDGKPYISRIDDGVNAEIIEKINIDGKVSYILEVRNIRTRKELPFDLKIVADLNDVEDDVFVQGIKYTVSVGGKLKPMQTTNGAGEVIYSGLTGTGEVVIRIQEVSVPKGFIHDTTVKEIVIDRNALTYAMAFIATKSNVLPDNVEIDYQNQLITVYMKKKQEFKINVEKVDIHDPTKKLEGAQFEITSTAAQHYRQGITTDSDGMATATWNQIVPDRTVRYTIKEIAPPTGYRTAREFQLEIEFTVDGRILNYEIVDHDDPDDPVTWAEINLPYKKEMDPTTGKYITVDQYRGNSEITITVKDNNRYNFVINKVDTRSNTNGQDSVLISGASFDVDIAHSRGSQTYSGTTVDGYLRFDNLEGSGEITINYEETSPAYGYVSTGEKGTIVFTKDELNQLTLDTTKTTVPLSRVFVDNYTGDVTVIVQNQSEFKIGVKVVDAITEQSLGGGKYRITSSEGASDTIISAMTGEATANVGNVYRGKTVRYTITHEIAPTGYSRVYELIDDIIIDVQFDVYGSAKSYMIIQGEDRVKNIELPYRDYSYISPNFRENEMNLEITNGEQDEYTIRLVKENELNSSVKVKGAEFQIIGIETDGTHQFNIPNGVTNSSGVIQVEHVDIQDGFKVTLQEITNGEGYTLDTTLRTVNFETGTSTLGEKIIEASTTDDKITLEVDNLNNIIEIRVTNEPRDISLVINKVDINDPAMKLKDAQFDIVDVSTGRTYTVITGDGGVGYTSIPLKADGTYKYKIVESEPPKGYEAVTEMEIEIDFANNQVVATRESAGGDIYDINKTEAKYIELTVRNVPGGGLPAYTIEVVRVNEKNLSQKIPNAKTKIEVTNVDIATITKNDYTNARGSIYINDAIRGPGETGIAITETEKAAGFVWSGVTRVVEVERDPISKQIYVKSTSNISSSRVSIDHDRKLIKIIIGSVPQDVYINPGVPPSPAYTVQLVSNIVGTTTAIEGYYSIDISPGPDNTMLGWTTSGYQFLNKRTERDYITGSGSNWNGWLGRYDPQYNELGTITMKNLTGCETILIDVSQVSLPQGMVGLPDTQHIEIYRDPTNFELRLVQEGTNTITTFVQDQHKIVITVNVTPVMHINLEKQDSKYKTEKLENVEFEVTSSIGTATTVVTGAGGAAEAIVGETKPNTTIVYTIKETKWLNGYKKTDDIQLEVRFNKTGRIASHRLIAGTPDAQIYFPTQPYYPQGGDSYPAINYGIYNNTLNTKIVIDNDDTFKFQIKNEDIEMEGMPVVGSKFKITMDDGSSSGDIFTGTGGGVGSDRTNSSGILTVDQIKGRGEIKLHYEQVEAGDGYRTDTSIKGDIVIYKDPVNYKVTLKSFTGPAEDIQVDENEGVIIVTVRNERKLDMKIEKVEINNPDTVKLSGAEFTIKSKIIERGGIAVSEDQVDKGTITTDSYGLAELDLGKGEPQTVAEYMIEETKAPDGYNGIGPIRITVSFDQQGHIQNVSNSTSSRTTAMKAGKGTIGLRIANGNINVNANGENVLGYNFKIHKTDRQIVGNPVNDATFNVKVYENGVDVVDTNIVTQDSTILGSVFEQGMAVLQNLTSEGTITVVFTEIQSPEGYVLDSTTYRIEFDVAYKPAEDYIYSKDLIPTITLNTASIDPLSMNQIEVDNINREIKVKLDNEPEVIIGLRTMDPNNPGVSVPGKEYRITSREEGDTEIYLNTYVPSTDQDLINEIISDYTYATSLDVNGITDASGQLYLSVGRPVPGKTVVYIVEELNADGEYEEITKLAIEYDANGKIEKYYLLTDNSNVDIDHNENYVGKSHINLNIATKQPDIEVGPYSLNLIKVDKDDFYIRIPGAKFQIDVRNEEGMEALSKTDTTDNSGIINIAAINGAGEIQVDLKELEAPADRRLDPLPKKVVLYRDPDNGLIEMKNAENLDFDIDNTNQVINIYVRNQLSPDKYNFVVAKTDNNDKLIAKSGAKFEITEKESGRTAIHSTDTNGKIILEKLDMPQDRDIATYIVRELEAPEGYILNSEEIEVVLQFGIVDGERAITSATVTKGSQATISKQENQYASVNVVNIPKNVMKIELEKVDLDDEKLKISEATFEVKDKETGKIQTVTTDLDGIAEAELERRDEGTYEYIVTETVKPSGYMALTKNIEFKVTYTAGQDPEIVITKGEDIAKIDTTGGIPKLQITNDQQYLNPIGPYSIDVVKVDENNKYIRLPGAKLQIDITSETGVSGVRKTDITDENGVISINEVNASGASIIQITELEAPNNRELDTSYKSITINRDPTTKQITLSNNMNLEAEIDNENQKVTIYVGNKLVDGKYALVLNKVDENNSLIKEPGIKFTIQEEGSLDTIEYVTDENGLIIFPELDMPDSSSKTYIIKEIQAPEGYDLNDEEIYLNIEFSDIDGRKVISNATIEQGENAVVAEQKEQYVSVNIINKLKDSVNIEIEKVDTKDNKLKISEAIFQVEEVASGETQTVTTNADGIANIPLIKQDEGENYYIIREVTAPSGYIDLAETVEFKVTWVDNQISDVTIVKGENIATIQEESENPRIQIINTQQDLEPIGAYTLDVVKVDKNDYDIKVPGAKLQIDIESETGVSGVRKTDITNENGVITINELNSSGTIEISVTELEAPNNRRLNTETKTVSIIRNPDTGEITLGDTSNTIIDNENKKVTVFMENELVAGKYNLVLNKVDKDNNPIKVAGVKFTIQEVGSTVATEYITNEDGKIFLTELDMPNANTTRYIIKEIEGPAGYGLNPEEIYLDIEFSNMDGEKVISNATITQGDHASIVKQEKQHIALNVINGPEKLYIRSDVYVIDDTYIDRIKPETTVLEFINNCETNGIIKIYDKAGNELGDSDIIGTGMQLTVSGELLHTLVVIGDVNGNGILNVTDIAQIKLAEIGSITLENEYFMAADISYDKKISSLDRAMAKQYLIGMIEF